MTGPLDPADRQQRRTSFGSVAAGYAAHRPGYPAGAVASLLGGRPLRVLDLGAGTGLLTGVLLAAGHGGGRGRPVAGDARPAPHPGTPASRPRSGARSPSRCPTARSTPWSPGRPRTGSTPSRPRPSCAACCDPRAGRRRRRHPQLGTRDYVATMTAGARAAFLGSIRDLLATHPDTAGRDVVDLPYRTDAYRLTPR